MTNRGPSEAEIEAAICCPNGCLFPDDCKRRKYASIPESAKAIQKLFAAAAKVRGDDSWIDTYKLPCDVRLPPATIIRAGCPLRTLIVGLIVRETPSAGRPIPMCDDGGWRDIETAPKDGTRVDLWCANASAITSGPDRVPDCWFFNGHWRCYIGDTGATEAVHNATHWRPLPDPPATEERSDDEQSP